MKRVFVRTGVYLVFFPAVAIVAYLVSNLTLNVNFGLIIGFGYFILSLPALLTSIVDSVLLRTAVGLRPLLVTLAGVLASQFVASRGLLSGMPDLHFYAAIASLTCCLAADRFQLKA